MNLESTSGSDVNDTASVHDTGPTLDMGSLAGGTEISLRGGSLETKVDGGSEELRAPGYDLTTPESFEEVENTSRAVVNRYTGKVLGEGAGEVQKRTENLTVTLTDADAFSPTELGRHTMGSGEVEIRNDMTDMASLHVTTHEIMHGTSYSDVSRHAVLLDARTIGTETVLQSGIHQVVEKTNPAGEVIELSDRNRTLNEGLTETYTLRAENDAFGETLDSGVVAYSTAREYAARLESIVGEEALQDAYFHGKLEELAKRVDELGGQNAWESLNRNLDTLSNPELKTEIRKEAKENLDDILNVMQINKLKEDNCHVEGT